MRQLVAKAGAAILLAASFNVGAQTAAEIAEAEKVVVTGSAIPSPDLYSEHPITVITAREIEQSGAVSVQQLLQRVSAAGFQGLTSNQNSLGSVSGTGNNFADLRNLGQARTLVLVDGKRLAPSSNVTFEGVDIGAIPLSLIDHIEILRDGASPIYGSDAIGGVVNIIVKKRFDGVLLGGGYGISSHGDGQTTDAFATMGKRWDRASLIANFEFSKVDPILQHNRDWSQNMVLDIEPNGSLTTFRNPGGIAVFNPAFVNPATGVSSTRWVADGNGAYHPYTAADRYDLATNNFLTLGQERSSANLLGSFDLAPGTSAYAQMFYTDRHTDSQHGPAVLGLTPVTIKYPDGFQVPASALGNPFGRSLVLSKDFAQVGNQIGTVDGSYLRFVAGTQGELWGRYHWDIAYDFGHTNENFKTQNALNFTHAEQEVGAVPCSAADVAAGCVAGDMFGPNSLTPAAINYLRYTSTANASYDLNSLTATANGSVMKLPAGPLDLAIGSDVRRLSGAFTPDAVTLAGDQQGADAQPTNGGYNVDEAFAEIKAPLIAMRPFLRELDVNAAVRLSHYSPFGTNHTWKAGADWQVNRDLRFRASGSTGLRAPSITELYGGRISSANAFNDPCDSALGLTANPVVATNCAAQGVPKGFSQPTNNYATLLGGNPNLLPETSRNFTGGVVLTPAAVPRLSVTVDYWRIQINNAIGALNASTVLQTCYTSPGLSSPLCALIGPRSAALDSLTTLNDIESNNGGVITDGLDVNFAYAFNLNDLGLANGGRVALKFDNTFTFSNRQQAGANGPFVELAGTVDQPTSSTNPGASPNYRSVADASWSRGPLTLGWTGRYIGGVWALGSNRSIQNNYTPAVTYSDVVASYHAGRVTLTAGIDNVFNRNPPFYDDGTVNTSEFTYDLVGRFYYLKVRARF